MFLSFIINYDDKIYQQFANSVLFSDRTGVRYFDKMPKISLLLFVVTCLQLCKTSGAEVDPGDLSFVYNGTLEVPDSKLAKEIADSISSNNVYNFTTNEVLDLFKVSTLNLDEVYQIVGNVTPKLTQNDFLGLIEHIMQQRKVRFHALLQDISEGIDVEAMDLIKGASICGIDQMNYQSYVLSSKKNEFLLIRNNSCTLEQIDTILKENGKTLTDLLEVVKTVFLPVQNISLPQILQTHKIPFQLLNQLRPLALSDLNKIPSVEGILNEIKTINATTFNGIAINNTGVIVNRQLLTNLTRPSMVDFQIWNSQDRRQVEATTIVVDKRNYAILPVKFTENQRTIELGTTENNIQNCTYIFVSQKATMVPVYNVTVEANTIVGETETSVFVRGGPLICNGKAYGLALENNDTVFIFDSIYTALPDIEPDNGDNGNNGSATHSIAFLMMVMSFILAKII